MLSRTQLERLLTLSLSAQTARKAIPPYLGDRLCPQDADAILRGVAEWDESHGLCALHEEVSCALAEANGLAWHHNTYITRRRGKTNYELELDP